ncbi:MAG: LPS export ABC transporter permease LptF [Candidatus Schekmanbacteria bacterium]|nr:MAG: LPS export ABC transporter permease LptF [Candidatus Schekmanbacteria bacterium]
MRFSFKINVLDRYIFSEIIVPFLSLLLICTMLVVLGNLGTLMELLINKGAGFINMVLMISYIVPQFLGFIIPIALFFAVISAMVRLSSDREIDALKASGISLYRIARPVIFFSAICWLAATIIMTDVAPRAYERFKEQSIEVLRSSATIGLKPVMFNEITEGLVIYAEDIDSNGKLKGVLISDSRDEKHKKVIFARKGKILPSSGEGSYTKIALEDGTIHIRGDVTNEYRMLRFEDFDFRIDLSKQINNTMKKSYRMMSVNSLIGELSKYNEGDSEYNTILISLNQKFAIPFMCLVFGILGIPFGIIFQRSSREPGYVICILLMIIFFVVFMGGKRMGEEGVLNPVISTWFPDLIFFAIGLYLFERVSRDKSSWILELSQRISAAIERFNEKIIGQKDF